MIFKADKSFNNTFFFDNELLEEICFLNRTCMLTRKAQQPVVDTFEDQDKKNTAGILVHTSNTYEESTLILYK